MGENKCWRMRVGGGRLMIIRTFLWSVFSFSTETNNLLKPFFFHSYDYTGQVGPSATISQPQQQTSIAHLKRVHLRLSS